MKRATKAAARQVTSGCRRPLEVAQHVQHGHRVQMVRVPHGGGYVAMSKAALNDVDRHAFGQHVIGVGMAPAVRARDLLDASLKADALHHLPHVGTPQRLSLSWSVEDREHGVGAVVPTLGAVLQPLGHERPRLAVERDHALVVIDDHGPVFLEARARPVMVVDPASPFNVQALVDDSRRDRHAG